MFSIYLHVYLIFKKEEEKKSEITVCVCARVCDGESPFMMKSGPDSRETHPSNISAFSEDL